LALKLGERVSVWLAVSVGAAASPVAVVATASAGSVAAPGIVDAGKDGPPSASPGPVPAWNGAQADVEEPSMPSEPTSPPAAARSEADVVESIGAEDADAGTVEASEPVRAKPERASGNRTEVAGWARESTEWILAPSGFRRGSPSALDVPHDRFISRTQLFVRASHVRGRWFEATVSGVLGYSFREQGPSGDADFDGVNGQATTADPQADLRELYVGLFSKYVDFRIGQQRVAWGRADLQSPNDVLNARDLRDPILTETELRHVPTPLIRFDIDLGAVNVELVGTPVFVPDVYDVYGTNWAAIQQDAPAPVKQTLALLAASFDSTKQGGLNALLHETQLPGANWTDPSGGAKVSAEIGGIDVGLYYHYGFDSTPVLSLTPSPTSLLLTPAQAFSATYVRRHHIGFDAAATAGPFAMRVDAAFETERVYYHAADLTSQSSPSVMAVASIEYQTGDIDQVLLVEGIYNRVVEIVDSPLLGYDQDSFGVAATLRWPLWAGLSIDLRGLAGVEPVSLVLQPALRLKVSDATSIKAGAVLLDGEVNSLGWYYRHNTSAFLQVKYSF
jgi:hypothetical protein